MVETGTTMFLAAYPELEMTMNQQQLRAQQQEQEQQHQQHHQHQQQSSSESQPLSEFRTRAASFFQRLGRSESTAQQQLPDATDATAAAAGRMTFGAGDGDGRERAGGVSQGEGEGREGSDGQQGRGEGACSSGSDRVDASSSGKQDDEEEEEEEWHVREVVQQRLEDFIFDEAVWATLRLLAPEDMHVKERRLKAKCEAYMPVQIQVGVVVSGLLC